MVCLDYLDLWYCSTLLGMSMRVIMCVAFEYDIVFFRENLAAEVIQDIQGHQEGRSVFRQYQKQYQ